MKTQYHYCKLFFVDKLYSFGIWSGLSNKITSLNQLILSKLDIQYWKNKEYYFQNNIDTNINL